MSQQPKTLQEALRDLGLEISDNETRMLELSRELQSRTSAKTHLLTEYQRTIAQIVAIDQYAKQEEPRVTT